MGQQRKKDKPGEPRKNGTGGSFATVAPDSDQGIDLAASAQRAISMQFIREQWIGLDDSEDGFRIADAASVVGVKPHDVADTTITDQGWVNFQLHRTHRAGGYDTVGVRAEPGVGDVVIYRADTIDNNGAKRTNIHREDGPAMIRHGRASAYLDGVEQHCPNTLGGYRIRDEQFTFTRGDRMPNGGWDARWETSDGRSVVRRAEGQTTFYNQAGSIERAGAPAVIDADGTEHWYHQGAEYPDPRPVEPTSEHPEGPESLLVTGDRYDPATKPARVAQAVDEDIRRAQLLGLLPADADIKVSGSDARKRVAVTGVPDTEKNAAATLVRGIVARYNRRWYPPRGRGEEAFQADVR